MKISDSNIFYDSDGNRVLNIGRGIDFGYGSVKDVIIESPGVLISNNNFHVQAGLIGAFTVINENTRIRFTKSIGRFCSIGPNCEIGMAFHPIHNITASDVLYASGRWKPLMSKNYYNDFEKVHKDTMNANPQLKEEIEIGNDVWIGSSVKIVGRVRIGDGAVIGTGAVVTKDVEPYTIVAGVPAKVIGKRFSDEIINRLLKIKWWNYGPDILTGIDVVNVDETCIDLIEKRIDDGFPLYNATKFKFSPGEGVIKRIEEDQEIIIYNPNEKEIKHGGISTGKAQYNQMTNELKIFGWFLPSYSYDHIEIYSGDIKLGDADLHCIRTDVREHFPEYGDSRSGWSFKKNVENIEDVTVICKKDGICIKKIEHIKVDIEE